MNAAVIQTMIDGELKVYKVSGLSAIKLEIREFDGDFSNIKSPAKSGLHNYITFVNEGEMLKYENIQQMSEITDSWVRARSINYTLLPAIV